MSHLTLGDERITLLDRSEVVTGKAGGARVLTLPACRPVMLEEEVAC